MTSSASANFEAPADAGANNVYDIVVHVNDGVNPGAIEAVAIAVTNVDEAPFDIAGGPLTVNEDSGTGSVVGTLVGQDPDNQALTYTQQYVNS